MTDLLIRDVDVVDGTGAARYRADVLVDRGRITEISSPRTASGADKIIDPGPGYVLAPGFIDMHAHSDLRAELRLLPLLTTHLSFREIAERLFVSRNTVKTQAISVYRKLGVSSRSEAIERATELGLFATPAVDAVPRPAVQHD